MVTVGVLQCNRHTACQVQVPLCHISRPVASAIAAKFMARPWLAASSHQTHCDTLLQEPVITTNANASHPNSWHCARRHAFKRRNAAHCINSGCLTVAGLTPKAMGESLQYDCNTAVLPKKFYRLVPSTQAWPACTWCSDQPYCFVSSFLNESFASVGFGSKSHLAQLARQLPGCALVPTIYPGLASHSPDSAHIGHSCATQKHTSHRQAGDQQDTL